MKTHILRSFLLFTLIAGLGELTPLRVLASSGSEQIFGYVTDDMGNPVPNIAVIGDDYVGDYYPFRTDDTGYYSVDVDSDGNYEVGLDCNELGALGYGCIPPTAVSVSGGAVTVNFVVPSSAPPPPLQIPSASLPSGTVTSPYAAQLIATDGEPPYFWELALNSPKLPAGLDLTTDGFILGTPKTNGTFAFKAQVTDQNSDVTNRVFFLTINRQPSLLTPTWLTNRLTMRLFGATNQNYTIQMSTNLASLKWVTLYVTNNAFLSSFIVVDGHATNRQRFYRVIVGP